MQTHSQIPIHVRVTLVHVSITLPCYSTGNVYVHVAISSNKVLKLTSKVLHKVYIEINAHVYFM